MNKTTRGGRFGEYVASDGAQFDSKDAMQGLLFRHRCVPQFARALLVPKRLEKSSGEEP